MCHTSALLAVGIQAPQLAVPQGDRISKADFISHM
jgi:hypothetical protein